jgi:uncharacterized protein (DUF2062 family)
MRARIHALWLTLLSQHTTPLRVALAVWVGVIVGCTPFFGLHLPICIAIAWALGLNQIIVYAAANISIPPIAAVLGFMSVQLGVRLIDGRWPGFDLATFRGRPLIENAKLFFSAWAVGGLIVGTVVGAAFAYAAWIFATKRYDRFDAAMRRASKRYRPCPAKYRFYAYFKYRMDPVYREVARHVPPKSHTVDFGAGLNMLGAVLNEIGEERRTTGVEWDANKVRAAELAVPDIAIRKGDVREAIDVPTADVVTIIDMLHYFPRVDVEKIIHNARTLLGIGGVLLVRESDRSKGSAWTRFLERRAVAMRWNNAPGTLFLSKSEIEEMLRAAGFSVEARSVSGALHPGNVLYVCQL